MLDVARSSIAPFANHGGRLDLARAAFPGDERWIDLSTGLARWCYPARLSGVGLERLPDPAALRRLEAVAAAAFGTRAERIVAVPGSDLALRLLASVIGGPAAVVSPGYSGHLAMWPPGAAIPVAVDAIDTVVERVECLVLARPNNPDGVLVERDRLEARAAALAKRGGTLVVDEAFVDATPEVSLAALDWSNLVVLRSFGKFFGLAGLRLGFVIAPPPIVEALRRLLGDWPLSGTAIEAGTAAYADGAWQQAQRSRLHNASARLNTILDAAGLDRVGGTPFFRLVMTPARDALFAHLARAGILTRPFADSAMWLRIGLPDDDAEWGRLETALHNWRRP